MKLFSILEKQRVNSIIKKDRIPSLSLLETKIKTRSPLTVINEFNKLSTLDWNTIINEFLNKKIQYPEPIAFIKDLAIKHPNIKEEKQNIKQNIILNSLHSILKENNKKDKNLPSINFSADKNNMDNIKNIDSKKKTKAIGPNITDFSILQTISNLIETSPQPRKRPLTQVSEVQEEGKIIISKDKKSKYKEGTKDYNILKYKQDRKESLKRKESLFPEGWEIYGIGGNPKYKGIPGKRKYSTIRYFENLLPIGKKEDKIEKNNKRVNIPSVERDIDLLYMYFLFKNYKNLTISLPRLLCVSIDRTKNLDKIYSNLIFLSLTSAWSLIKKVEDKGIKNINYNNIKDIILENRLNNKIINKENLNKYKQLNTRWRDVREFAHLNSVILPAYVKEMLDNEEFLNFLLNISVPDTSIKIENNITDNFLRLRKSLTDKNTKLDSLNKLLTPTIYCLETNSFSLIYSTSFSNLEKEADWNKSQDLFSYYRCVSKENGKLFNKSFYLQTSTKGKVKKEYNNKVYYIMPYSLMENLMLRASEQSKTNNKFNIVNNVNTPLFISKKAPDTESLISLSNSTSYPNQIIKKNDHAQAREYYMNFRKFLYKYNLISHPTNPSASLGHYQIIGYNFIKTTKKINTLNSFDLTGYVAQFKDNISILLKYFFNFIGPALISKPVFIFNHNKIIIQLAYYLNKKIFYYKFKKYITIKYFVTLNKSNLTSLTLLNKVKNIKEDTGLEAFNNSRSLPYKEKELKKYSSATFPSLQGKIKIQKRNSILFVLKKKLNALTLFLEKYFNCSVQLEFTRLYYPFHNSNILAQIIGLNGKKYNFEKIVKFLFSSRIHAIINNPNSKFKNIDFFKNIKSTQHLTSFLNKSVLAQETQLRSKSQIRYNSLLSLLSGIKFRLAGRFYKHKIIPRKTVYTTQKGSLARGVVNYVDSSKFINKSKRGTFCVTISISHIY